MVKDPDQLRGPGHGARVRRLHQAEDQAHPRHEAAHRRPQERRGDTQVSQGVQFRGTHHLVCALILNPGTNILYCTFYFSYILYS